MGLAQMLPGEAELAGKLGKPFRHLARKFLDKRQQATSDPLRPDMGLNGSDMAQTAQEPTKRKALRGGRGYMNANSASALLGF